MTANVRDRDDRRSPSVLRVPNAALRFRPPGERGARRGPRARRPRARPRDHAASSARRRRRPRRSKARLVKALKLTDEQQKKLDPILDEARSAVHGPQTAPPGAAPHRGQRIREESRVKIRALLTPEQQAIYDQMPQGQAARGGAARPERSGLGARRPTASRARSRSRTGHQRRRRHRAARRRAQGGRGGPRRHRRAGQRGAAAGVAGAGAAEPAHAALGGPPHARRASRISPRTT